MFSRISSLVFAIVVILINFYRLGKGEALEVTYSLLTPLLFIWLGNQIIGFLGDSFIGFLTLGRVSSLSGDQLKAFGWFLLVFLSLVNLFVPGFI